jgi:hypothetical protein
VRFCRAELKEDFVSVSTCCTLPFFRGLISPFDTGVLQVVGGVALARLFRVSLWI